MLTSANLPAGLLQRVGLPAADAESWAASAPGPDGSLPSAAAAVSRFLARGKEFLLRLPSPADCTADQRAARDAITQMLNGAREGFLEAHAAALYDAITGGRTRALRLEDVLRAAAEQVPGLVPSAAEMEAERARKLADKEGIELAQGLLFAHILAVPQAGRHLIGAMLRPVPEAFERLGELRATGAVDLGPARVTRRGPAGVLELRNPRHLNAEDGVTLGPTECAVDMILLDPDVEVGVFRGAAVDHPRYRGERVFGAGLNLTHLYYGRLDFLFFLLRDLGYVSKIYRGLELTPDEARPTGKARDGAAQEDAARDGAAADGVTGDGVAGGGTVEKLWVATVERFAIGGACQLLHVVDHVIATRGSRLFLPARKEGIIPGASNLRLPRFVGDRAARQAILSGREWTAGEPDAAALVDEVVEPGEMEAALEARISALTSSGLVNAAANRRAMRVGAEPLDVFREYMAAFSEEQARCHLSPALVANLEEHWNAHRRSF